MYNKVTTAYTILFIVIFFIGVFFILFFFALIKYQKRYYLLYKQLLSAEILSQEKERKRIAADIHDDLGQLLALSKIQLQSACNAKESQHFLIHETINQIETVLLKMKTLCTTLSPPSLAKKGLSIAIKNHIKSLGRLRIIKISYTITEAIRLKNEQSEIHLFRIYQEIITNALKHANATELNIQLTQSNQHITLSVSDNGVGFNKTNSFYPEGMGLKNIENRVHFLNGQLQLNTSFGKGTSYTIKIPKNE